MNAEKEVIKLLNKELKLKGISLEAPPDPKLGDFAFPCFQLSKKFKKNPVEISKELSNKLKPSGLIKEIKQAGPYLNFFIDKQKLAESLIKEILRGDYGKGKAKKEKVMVEYSQANTHKAFHVGHLRGTCLGESLARILKYSGYNVIQANYQGDTGAHVAKWLWCYLKFHKGEKPPKKDPERWIADIYVEAVKKSNQDNQKEIEKINYQLENKKDKELMNLWKESRKWSLDILDDIYKDLDAHFDKFFFEREVEARGKEIAEELVKKGIAKIDDGAALVDLEKYRLGIWILLRKDGTCLYSAKDLALAEKKFKEFKIDKSIYVVGNAQNMHMQQLFKTLELMKFKQAKKCFHLSYAMVRMPTGKMSSRTGENILYLDLKNEIINKLKQEVEKRHKDWNSQQKAESVLNIFSSAIKFDFLMQDPNKDIIFDIEKALDFEGETGPYIQYVHARICSIFNKNGKFNGKFNAGMLKTEYEEKIINLLSAFPDTIEKSAESYKPHLIARYLIELSQSFNEFYHNCPILQADKDTKQARLGLISAVKEVIKTGLDLLGIESPEVM